MPDVSRSGRLVIPAGVTRAIVLAGLVGNNKAIYRIFNGGKSGSPVEVQKNGAAVHTLAWKDSVDLSVGNETVGVKAGATEAEISYDLIHTL